MYVHEHTHTEVYSNIIELHNTVHTILCRYIEFSVQRLILQLLNYIVQFILYYVCTFTYPY